MNKTMENVMIKPDKISQLTQAVYMIIKQNFWVIIYVWTKQQQGPSFPHYLELYESQGSDRDWGKIMQNKYVIPVLLTCGKISLQTSSGASSKFRFFFRFLSHEKYLIFRLC